jgi:hypothetical protein
LTILHFECLSGAAGDMILGALIDAGVPMDEVRRALGSLAIGPDAVWTERVTRSGITATKFHVVGEQAAAQRVYGGGHGHHHHPHAHEADAPHHHEHRTLAAIEQLIDSSALSAAGKRRAKHLFGRLADAEAAIHGTPREQVHLHEVGALDSIIDIVGTVHAMEVLGADRVTASHINVGGGTVRTSHGMLPVPTPATERLLRGVPIYSGTQRAELVTPTGALLITEYAEDYGAMPAMRLDRIGYGAGSQDFHDAPNVVRVLLGEADREAGVHSVVVIEAEIDDMNPQIFGILIDRLMAAGALDVFYTPIQMKKNRPGTLVSIVAPVDARERLSAIVFRETTTIGVRYTEMKRECLDRERMVVETPYGPIGIKIARRNGELLNASPEFEDCARAAAGTGKPVKDVHAAAVKAFLDRS